MLVAQSAAAGLWPEGQPAQVAGSGFAPVDRTEEPRAVMTSTDHDLIVDVRIQ